MELNLKSQKSVNRLSFVVGLMFALSLSACGKTAYMVTSSQQSFNAPGTYTIPPKVDILLAQDNSGSTYTSYNSFAQQATSFLTNLDKQGWDYHFATVPLTTQRPFSQVAGSKYDGNTGAGWVAPYPGAPQNSIGMINPMFFSTPANYTNFVGLSDVSSIGGGMEPGFLTIQWALTQGLGNTNFLRSDALLVIVVTGNGNDTSYVNFCKGIDGNSVPCDNVGGTVPCTPTYDDPTGGNTTCGSSATSLAYFKNWFSTFKPGTLIYSMVSPTTSSNCLGGSAYAGTRYISLAKQNFNVCTQSLTSALSSLSSSLTAERKSFKQDYIMISQDANPDTIVVTEYPNGDTSNPVIIPEDPVNGWTYVGYQQNIYTIDYPADMNLASGYAIQLHGSAVLVGGTTVNVSYKPAGAKDAVSN